MKIYKVINNNVLSAYDDKKQEVVVMGRGIGFKAKAGDTIDEGKIEKVFHIENSELSRRFQEMISEMPLEHMQISADIISYAKEECNMKLNQSIYLALMDHINFAIGRYRQGIQLPNALLGEIRQFYRREYLVGEYALRIIATRLGVHFTEDEAGFIALHFVNAVYDTTTHDAYVITDMLTNSLAIVKREFGGAVNEHSMHYERFMAHLKFLARRIFSRELLENAEEQMAGEISRKYAREHACSVKIADYIHEKYGAQLTGEELMYMTIHIRRVLLPREQG